MSELGLLVLFIVPIWIGSEMLLDLLLDLLWELRQ